MLRGLWRLTWLEIKIFVREPMGLIGSVVIPVLMFLVLGRTFGPRLSEATSQAAVRLRVGLPVFVAVFIAISAVLSLVAILSIYRESGILKRLRATPLRPVTILVTHVLVKLLLTAVTVLLMVLAAGATTRGTDVRLFAFSVRAAALHVEHPVHRLYHRQRGADGAVRAATRQPVLYTMLPFCGLFFPIDSLSPSLQTVSKLLPLTYAVSLLSGIWQGNPWSAHLGDIAALIVIFAVCTWIASRVFRWE